MIHAALLFIELARERLSQVRKSLASKKKLQPELRSLALLCLGDWDMTLKDKRRSFLTQAVKDWCRRMHDHEWLDVCLAMTHKDETLLSARAKEFTLTSREDDAEKMELVVRTFWSLRRVAESIEQAAATLHAVVEASYKISRSISAKSKAMKAIVSSSEREV